MPYTYTPPDFLQNQSVDEIHQRMLSYLPDNMDKSEGQLPWDFTRPAAIEKSMFIQFQLNELVQIAFVQWAYGQWLDEHALSKGIKRKSPNKASGEITVTAAVGTVIPAGFQFATPAGLSSSVIFETSEKVSFDAPTDAHGNSVKKIPVTAANGGVSGNVAADSIKLMVKPLSGISAVTNEKPITGGTAEEDDESLRERILSSMQNGVSYVGCDADYVRWAKEIPAVGNVIVEPEWSDPDLPPQFHYTDKQGCQKCAGAVRLIITDANGAPANEQILNAVFNHIISPDTPENRLAPIGAKLTVCAPSPVYISISASVTIREDDNITDVKDSFINNLNNYWVQAVSEGSVKYVFIGSVLANTNGVLNYSPQSLKLNSSTADIPISISEFPVISEVNIRASV